MEDRFTSIRTPPGDRQHQRKCRVAPRRNIAWKATTRGRTLATYRVDVTRQDGRTVALFTGTVFITAPKP